MVIELAGVIEFIASGERLMEADMYSLSMKLHIPAVLHAAFMLVAAVIGVIRLIGLRTTDGAGSVVLFLLSGVCGAAISYLQGNVSPRNFGKNNKLK